MVRSEEAVRIKVRRITGFVSASDLVDKLQKTVEITRSEIKELREQR